MTLDEMIEVLTAYKNGEKIECGYNDTNHWTPCNEPPWNFSITDYRIAPKKEMTLVERLRYQASISGGDWGATMNRAANRIKILEEMMEHPVESVSTDELLEELKRRMK